MVKQTRHIFDLNDILHARIVCGLIDESSNESCNGEVMYQFGSRRKAFEWVCPKCGHNWVTVTQGVAIPPQEKASSELLAALDALACSGSPKFTIRFEIDDAENQSKT